MTLSVRERTKTPLSLVSMGTTTPINVLGPTGQTQELCVYAGVKEVGRIKVLVVICMQRGD